MCDEVDPTRLRTQSQVQKSNGPSIKLLADQLKINWLNDFLIPIHAKRAGEDLLLLSVERDS